MGYEDDNTENGHAKGEVTEGGYVVENGSVHAVGQDDPWEVGFQLANAVDNAFILGYALLVFAFLGWALGVIFFIVGGVLAAYCSYLIANLHVIDGVRYVRFRDIAARCYGTPGFWITVVLQWLNILAGNVGLMILAGQSLYGLYTQYNDSGDIGLKWWVAVAACGAVTMAICIPDLHQLRLLSAISAVCILTFVSICIGISIRDGINNHNAGLVSYALFGDTPSLWFDAMGTTGTIAFAYTTVITPEIQATVRDPPVTNFYKSLAVNYLGGGALFMTMSIIAYWAYGNSIAPNVILSLSGPKWAITVAWVAVYIQTIVSLQIYSFPVYETIDTAFSKNDESAWSPYNLFVRIAFRLPYVCCTSFCAAALPFFGDFIALIGALTVLPLAFVMTILCHVAVNKDKISAGSVMFHYCLAGFFAVVTLSSSIAAVRYIVVDSIHYDLFASIE